MKLRSLFRKYSLVLIMVPCFVLLEFAVPRIADAYGMQMRLPPGMGGITIAPSLMASTNPRSSSFFSRLLDVARNDKTHVLWLMYPASIRGRIFQGNDTTTSNPMVSGGW